MKGKHLSLVIVLGISLTLPLKALSQGVIKEWNTIAVNMTLTASPAQSPQQQTRTMAIYSAAVHDAVNGVTGEYETYLSPGAAPDNASAKAAAIAGSYRALCGLFGTTACTNLQPTFLQSLVDYGVTVNDPGVPYGFDAAQDVLDARANDGASVAQFPWNGPNELPGTFRLLPTQPNSLLSGMGSSDTVRAEKQFTVPARGSAGSRHRGICQRLQ